MTRRLVVEADGGSRGNPGPAAYGALVVDADSGEVLARRAETIGTATNNVAEYSGLVAGLQAAARIDPTARVEVRMDSKLVIEQMAGRWKVKHPAMQPLARAARDAFPYPQVRWQWVPRAQNSRADALVNAALDGRPFDPVRAVEEPQSPIDVPDAPVAEPSPPGRRTWRPDLGDPTALVLVRHGETEDTTAMRFSGRRGADPPLSEDGEAQARAAAAALAGREVAAVVSSPLRRARQTAQAVADVLGLGVEVVEELAECAFGEWEGLTYPQVAERWPEELAQWAVRTDVRAPGGESLEEVAVRSARARDEIVRTYARRTVVLVAHVTPINSLVRLALDAPPSAVFRMAVAPGSLSEVHYWADDVASLRSLNLVPPAVG